MVKTNVRCPICGTVNYNLYLEETGGLMECECCKTVTGNRGDLKSFLPGMPRLKARGMLERSRIEVSWL